MLLLWCVNWTSAIACPGDFAGAEGDAASSAFMSRQALVTAQLDECEVLHRLLRDDALPRARAAAKDRESGS